MVICIYLFTVIICLSILYILDKNVYLRTTSPELARNKIGFIMDMIICLIPGFNLLFALLVVVNLSMRFKECEILFVIKNKHNLAIFVVTALIEFIGYVLQQIMRDDS